MKRMKLPVHRLVAQAHAPRHDTQREDAVSRGARDCVRRKAKSIARRDRIISHVLIKCAPEPAVLDHRFALELDGFRCESSAVSTAVSSSTSESAVDASRKPTANHDFTHFRRRRLAPEGEDNREYTGRRVIKTMCQSKRTTARLDPYHHFTQVVALIASDRS